MAYKVAIVCDNGNLFMNSKEFPTIQSAFDFMLEAQQLVDLAMAIEDENGKMILRKGVKSDFGRNELPTIKLL